MPFYNISTFELTEEVFFKSDSIKQNLCQMNSLAFTTILLKSVATTYYNGYSFRNSYCTDREFNSLVHDKKIQLSVFHLNIRSLNKHFNGLIHYLQLFNIEFDVLVLSEIWNYNLELRTGILKNYNFYYSTPVGSSVGGVGIYVKKIICLQ